MTGFDLGKYLDQEFREHDEVFRATQPAVREPFGELVNVCATALGAGRKLLFFGNGGSAADAQHLATELTVRYRQDRDPIAAIALTAIGNDLGFDQLFVRQVQALGRAGDVAIGISTSGRSRNVILALEVAREIGLTAAGFTGGDGGGMTGLAHPLLVVPSTTTSRIQEMHITLGQMLCGALERQLGLV